MESFKQWCVGLITLPHNFKNILEHVNTKKDNDDLNNNNNNNNEEEEGVRVICVGLSRTGTSSLKAALSQLLPGRTYHAMDLLADINSRETFKFWHQLSENTASKDDIRTFFSDRHYSAVCDIPCLQYWQQIAGAFPNARIVLTVRDPVAWYHSVSTTLLPLVAQIDRWSWMLSLMCLTLYQSRHQIKLLEILFRQLRFKEFKEEETAVRFYESWNSGVKEAVGKSNLLVFDVRDGWGPLCHFLGMEKPDYPFPRLNDSSALVTHQWYITLIICLFSCWVIGTMALVFFGNSFGTTLSTSFTVFATVSLSLFLYNKFLRE